jgi:hypothetical protein
MDAASQTAHQSSSRTGAVELPEKATLRALGNYFRFARHSAAIVSSDSILEAIGTLLLIGCRDISGQDARCGAKLVIIRERHIIQ